MNRKIRVLKLLRLIITRIESCEWSIEVFGTFASLRVKEIKELEQLKQRYNRILTKLEGF